MSGQETGRIEVKGLSKTFNDFEAIKDASFTVEPGSMTGFLGANGAGKTTTMRMVMGLVEPTAGDIYYSGKPMTAADRACFGYMPEERGLYPKQPILQQLVYLGRLRGMSASFARKRATDYLGELGLGGRLRDKLESLSLGNQQRVQIVASILHEPQALILDEPFSGVDPAAVDTMVRMLHELMRKGVPVLFSSHQLDLVDRLCDRIVILHAGQVVAQGSAEQLRAGRPVRYRYLAGADAGWLRELRGISVVDVNGAEALIELESADDISVVRAEILQRGVERDMHEFSRVLPTLGDIYRGVTNQ